MVPVGKAPHPTTFEDVFSTPQFANVPLDKVIVAPATVRFPPKVVNPVPVVTAPLDTVFRLRVPEPAERVRF